MRKSNFNLYLEEQQKDKDFAERFKKAGKVWGLAIRAASLSRVRVSYGNGKTGRQIKLDKRYQLIP
jgi:hypothetical protein